MSRDLGFEVLAGILSMAWTLIVTVTLLVCYVRGGSLWIYEDVVWLLNLEVGLGLISCFLVGDRLRRDLDVWREETEK